MSAEGTVDSRAGIKMWAPLIAVCLAMFIVVLDSTMMNVAVGAIAKDLKTSVSSVQAAISIYSLVMASLMLTGGKLGDMRGAKRMFVIGLGIYGVGTLLAALSWNVEILILGWSIIEGIGAALILPLAMTLIFSNYSGAQRAIAFGILGGVQASASAVGPILGGFLTSFFSWRWGFGLEVVIVIIIFFFIRHIRESERQSISLDWRGTILSTSGLMMVVLGFLLAGQYGFWLERRPFTIGDVQFNPFGLSPTPVFIVTGIALLIGFAHWQEHLQRTGRTPLLRMSLLANWRFMSGVGTDTFRQLGLSGLLFIIPVFSQQLLGFSAIKTGLAILPFSLGVFIISMTTANLAKKVAPKWLINFGVVAYIVGILWMWAVTSADMTIWDMVLPMFVMGVGIGFFVAQIVNLTISQVGDDERNEGAGTHNTGRELGGALGTAVIGSILLVGVFGGFVNGALKADNIALPPAERDKIAVELEDEANTLSAEDGEAFINSLPEPARGQTETLIADAYVQAQRTALLAIAAVMLIALAIGTFLPGRHKAKEKAKPDIRGALK